MPITRQDTGPGLGGATSHIGRPPPTLRVIAGGKTSGSPASMPGSIIRGRMPRHFNHAVGAVMVLLITMLAVVLDFLIPVVAR